MDFQSKLEMYAKLLVSHGLNVQAGQVVNITAELFHREFVQLLVQAAYRRGAKFVNVDFIDPELVRTRIQDSASDDYLRFLPRYIQTKFDDFVQDGACVLRLTGSEEPDSLADLPAQKVNAIQMALRQMLKHYYTEGVGKCRVQWTVAAVATPKWAKKVFPELDEKAAYNALWDAIFHICRADRPDCLAAWNAHQKMLHARSSKLNQLKVKELHFVGPGTDLRVGLSPKAVFRAGSSKTPQGVSYEANIPTEECFTTPDWRKTVGTVRVTRPVLVNGRQILDLQLEFRDGEVIHFSAASGYDNFHAFLANDPGAKRLGEVSVVGIDSPVYQSGRLFEEILYDENASCHIALGFAYRFCIDGGDAMNAHELENIGYNVSNVHTDFMISSDQVDVFAETFDGKSVQLIKKGAFLS